MKHLHLNRVADKFTKKTIARQMVTKDASPTILLLKANFPEFESQIDHIYFQDEVFREIAREYHECIDKQNIITNERSGKSDFYTDTIDELKEELLTYLSGNKQQ